MRPTLNPDGDHFPTRKELPRIDGAPEGAAWFWGEDDQIGRLNLLTPTRVAAAAKLVSTGEIVPVNLALTTPEVPAFGREQFQHKIKTVVENICYDDLYSMNTQSGTQWDGFRHFAHTKSGNFYNGARGSDFVGEHANHKCSIHHWSEHGIAGRGVLIDFWSYAQKTGRAYNAYGDDEITLDELFAAGKDQGIDLRPKAQGGDINIGDILFVRSGWTVAYESKPRDERNKLATRHSTLDAHNEVFFGGVKQDDRMLDWIHDSYFAAVAGDAPAFENWPSKAGYFLHEYILALWGMPLGEMLNLERLAAKCRERNQWFFFFTSSPANMPAGVATHVNGLAIF